MAIYVATFFLAAHSFVVFYEEPTLRRAFGAEYEAYCRRVRRWWPGCRRKNVKAFRLRTKLQRDEYGSLLKLRTYGHAEARRFATRCLDESSRA